MESVVEKSSVVEVLWCACCRSSVGMCVVYIFY